MLNITTFDRETAPTRGPFYTHHILFEIRANRHRSMISYEIANAGQFHLIIPFGWWHDEHPLKSIVHPKIYIFQEAKFHTHVEAEPGPDLFEWDETVAYDGEAQYVGRIGREEGDVQLETLPKPYWQYKELLGEKKVEMLASRRTFDYTSNLKEGAKPPWGPRYPILADQLNELDKYIKKILAQGKIVDSKSPYGAPILFIPKPDGCLRDYV